MADSNSSDPLRETIATLASSAHDVIVYAHNVLNAFERGDAAKVRADAEKAVSAGMALGQFAAETRSRGEA